MSAAIGAPLDATFALALPVRGDGELRMRWKDGAEVGVHEIGAHGSASIGSGTVSYPRDGGHVFWTTGEGERGFEEWLALDEGIAYAGRVVASWIVRGGTLRKVGSSVHVLDAHGVERLRVSAPRAFAASGEAVEAHLHVFEDRIALSVDADGSAVLVDPWWEPFGPIEPRTAHTASLLADGRVLVAGGYNDYVLASVELYDPSTDRWSVASSMPVERSGHTATVLADGRVLLVGGRWQGGERTSYPCVYDPIGDAWSYGNPMSEARIAHTATELTDGRVLVVGGAANYAPGAEIYDPSTDTWTAAGTLAHGRSRHTATRLADGRVLVAGGYGASDVYLRSAEIYDPTTNVWTEIQPMSVSRTAHAADLLPDGTVLVSGGQNVESGPGPRPLETCEIFSPSTGMWASAASLHDARESHVTLSLADGRVFAITGHGRFGQAQPDVEIYDAALGEWTAEESILVAETDMTATELTNGIVMVVGGTVDYRPIASASFFDAGSNSWNGNEFRAREGHTASVLPDGSVMVAGGAPYVTSYPRAIASVQILDSSTGTWRAAASMRESRQHHTASTLPDGRVLVVGGGVIFPGAEYRASSEIYDPASDVWSPAASMARGRGGHVAAAFPNGCVLVVGGYGGGGTLIETPEVYDPSADSWSDEGAPELSGFGLTASVLHDGRALVLGSSAYLYDSATREWRSASPPAYPRKLHSATVLRDGRVLVVGGYIDVPFGGLPLETVEIYDPRTDSWRYTGPLAHARYLHSATLLANGNVLVQGGSTAVEAEVFDVASETWTDVPLPTVPRAGHSDTLLANGDVLFIGGGGHGGTLGNWEVFHPGCTGACDARTTCDDAGGLITCGDCPAGTFSTTGTGAPYCHRCDDGTFNVAPGSTACLPSTPCRADEYESTPGTSTMDRACAHTTDCTAGEYESVAPTATTDRVCAAVTSCGVLEYEVSAPTPNANRVCALIRTCGAGEFEAMPSSPTRDRVCMNCGVCAQGYAVAVACSANSDTVCAPAPDGGSADASADASGAWVPPAPGCACTVRPNDTGAPRGFAWWLVGALLIRTIRRHRTRTSRTR